MNLLDVRGLKVKVADKEVLKGVDLSIDSGKIHVIMGPNGSGKSTLAQTVMGHPMYQVTEGSVLFKGNDLLGMDPTTRSLEGLFLSFQYPSEVEGLTISNYLRMIYNKRVDTPLSPAAFRKLLKEKMDMLGMKEEFMHRYLNSGFSGGEKKRMEMLQMLILEPKLAILDEVDSGLDIDALKIVAEAVNSLHGKSETSFLIITHYSRILNHINADSVHVMQDGKIVRSGEMELAEELEVKGYKTTHG